MKNFKNSDSKSYILTLLKKSQYNTHPVPSYQILISILVSEKKSHYSTTISIFHIILNSPFYHGLFKFLATLAHIWTFFLII